MGVSSAAWTTWLVPPAAKASQHQSFGYQQVANSISETKTEHGKLPSHNIQVSIEAAWSGQFLSKASLSVQALCERISGGIKGVFGATESGKYNYQYQKLLKKLSKNQKWWKVYKPRTSCSRTGSPRSDMELLNASGMELTRAKIM